MLLNCQYPHTSKRDNAFERVLHTSSTRRCSGIVVIIALWRGDTGGKAFAAWELNPRSGLCGSEPASFPSPGPRPSVTRMSGCSLGLLNSVLNQDLLVSLLKRQSLPSYTQTWWFYRSAGPRNLHFNEERSWVPLTLPGERNRWRENTGNLKQRRKGIFALICSHILHSGRFLWLALTCWSYLFLVFP